MIEKAQFAAGLGAIWIQLNQRLERDTLDAYHLALADETEPHEWAAFSVAAPKRFGWRFPPTVPDIVDALREFRGQPSLEVEAVAAYEAVMQSAAYTPEGGSSWTWRGVLATCGRAAADAWLEAGGHHAFATTWNEDRRRERFLAAYQQGARAEPATRLLLDADRKALPPPAEQPTREEAAVILRRIVERAN